MSSLIDSVNMLSNTFTLTLTVSNATEFILGNKYNGLCVFKNAQTKLNNYLIYNKQTKTIDITSDNYFNQKIQILNIDYYHSMFK